jgi:hypothetical protein|tara:strand:- start:2431 stop:2658 length:228 start_codon:yes stop_codon:yes gene_type:complete
MATTVSLRGKTKVKRVVVGKPVRRVIEAAGNSINAITGVNTDGAVEGSVLVYNASTTAWEATTTLDQQELNGGQY